MYVYISAHLSDPRCIHESALPVNTTMALWQLMHLGTYSRKKQKQSLLKIFRLLLSTTTLLSTSHFSVMIVAVACGCFCR